MEPFQFQKTGCEGLTLISPLFVSDERGYLCKSFELEIFAANGIDFTLSEELESKSCRNTLRGLHFQRKNSQDKLVRVLYGEVYDVAVDLRSGSPTFGKWQGFILSSENRQMLYIPKQFAHGFLVTGNEAVVHYLCGGRYDSDNESGIIWSDPVLDIRWPLAPGTEPLLSLRDRGFSGFKEFCRSAGYPY